MNRTAAVKPSNRKINQKAKLQSKAITQADEPSAQQARCYGAVDIGGTKIAVGIVRENGALLAASQFPTGTNPVAAVQEICAQLDRLQQTFCAGPLSGLGVSCAGPVDTLSGTVHNPYTLPGWDEYPLQKALSDASKLPVRLENDANCALLGEVVLSELTQKRVLMVSIGTGIGTAFWDGHGFYRTGGRFHPELGHLLISSRRVPASPCYCGHANCVENLLSGTALHRRAADAGFHDFTELATVLNATVDSRKTAASLFVQDLRAEFCELLWNYGLVFQPDCLILAGGMAAAYYELFASFQQDFLQETKQRQDFVPPFRLALAHEGANTALSGAGLLFQVAG